MKPILKFVLKYIIVIKIFVFSIVLGYLGNLAYSYKKAYNELIIEKNNNLALEKQNDSIIATNIVFKHTIEEIKQSKDSIDQVLARTIKKLKVKEREVKSLSYFNSQVSKTDTIIFRDTLFQQHTNIDTTLRDEWYSLNLQLAYPSKVVVTPSFKSEKMVVAKYKKVWLKRPKWWICRLFKKKDNVIEVTVIDNSPYVTDKEHKHIEIIK